MIIPYIATCSSTASPKQSLTDFVRSHARPISSAWNRYLTSERFLHSRVQDFPEEFAGGNGRDRYADVDAVRMPVPRKEIGPEARLREVWNRYKLPIAVTEAHHGSTREEQLRWLIEVWNAAIRLREKGVNVCAVTSWALFGAVDWNSLLSRESGFYEPGAFDIRNSPPRVTVIGRAVQSLAQNGSFSHPGTEQPGWWRRPERFYRPTQRTTALPSVHSRHSLLIAGDDTGPAQVFEAAVRLRGLEAFAFRRPSWMPSMWMSWSRNFSIGGCGR